MNRMTMKAQSNATLLENKTASSVWRSYNNQATLNTPSCGAYSTRIILQHI